MLLAPPARAHSASRPPHDSVPDGMFPDGALRAWRAAWPRTRTCQPGRMKSGSVIQGLSAHTCRHVMPCRAPIAERLSPAATITCRGCRRYAVSARGRAWLPRGPGADVKAAGIRGGCAEAAPEAGEAGAADAATMIAVPAAPAAKIS